MSRTARPAGRQETNPSAVSRPARPAGRQEANPSTEGVSRRATPRWVRSLGYWMVVYRRTWLGGVATSFATPVVYLAGMGLGVGSLIDDGQRAGDVGGDYLGFLAPGLLVATCFMGGAMDATYPVMGSVKWNRTYHAMAATPLRSVDLVLGHLAYMAIKLVVTALAFAVVSLLLGAVDGPADLIAIPAGVLTGVATAAPVMAWAVRVQRESSFSNLWRYVIIPLSLFGGTYFPLSQLPTGLELAAGITPLYHGTEIARSGLAGAGDWAAVGGHTLFLVGLTATAVAVSTRTFTRVLQP